MICNQFVDIRFRNEDVMTDTAPQNATTTAVNMGNALETVKDMLGLKSSSALANKMGVAPQRILTWKKRNTLSTEFVEFCISQLLDLNQVFSSPINLSYPTISYPQDSPTLLTDPILLQKSIESGADLCLQAGCVRPPIKSIKSINLDSDQIVGCLHMHLNFLEHAIHVLPQHIALIRIVGNNMAPWVTDGDMVIIDTSLTTIVNDAPYILQYDSVLVAKRLVRRQNGMIVATSDSSYCEDEVFSPETLPRIIGRIVRRLVR